MCVFVCVFVCCFFFAFCLFVCLFFFVFVCVCVCLFVYLFVCLLALFRVSFYTCTCAKELGFMICVSSGLADSLKLKDNYSYPEGELGREPRTLQAFVAPGTCICYGGGDQGHGGVGGQGSVAGPATFY